MANRNTGPTSLTRRGFVALAAANGLGAVVGPRARAGGQTAPERKASRVEGIEGKGPVVGAYYYPWYRASRRTGGQEGTAIGWMRKALRGRLEPPHMPRIGIYSSHHAETIAEHIAQSKRGGIDFWAVSWWGPSQQTDSIIKNHLLEHPDAGQLKYALLYESTGRLGSLQRPTYTRLLDDFQYMSQTYFDNPHYLRIDGRPVVFIYLTRVYFRDRGLDALRNLRKRFPQVYLVGDDVFGSGYRQQDAQRWDAVTAYDVYGQSLKTDGATHAALDRLSTTYANAKTIANGVGTGFIPAVSPGFNDRAVRNGHPGRARYFKDVPGSREGDIFRAMLRQIALPNIDSRAGNVMMVTSFNEWYEDTQIEATTGTAPPTTKDDSESGVFFTEGDLYADYGHLYLDILREETKRPSAVPSNGT
jgi:hypothetical protein